MTYYILALGIVLFILIVWLLLKKKGGTETAVSEKTPEERHLEARKRERNEKRAEEEAKQAKEETRRRLEATQKAEAIQKQKEKEALAQEAQKKAKEEVARKRAEGILKAKEEAKKREEATREREAERARAEAAQKQKEATPPALPEYPPFDHSRLIDMGLSDADASDFVKELIEQIETQIPLIEAVIAQQNFEEAEKLTHSIKGSATNIGTGGISDLIIAYNTYLKTQNDIAQIRCYQEALLEQLEKLKMQYL